MAHFSATIDQCTIGYYDGSITRRPWPELGRHYDTCYDKCRSKGIFLPHLDGLDETSRKLEYARIDTQYVTFYRFTPRKFWKAGAEYPLNWEDAEYKRKLHQRYSPIGTIGHYLGVSYEAALDEMHYYGDGSIDAGAYYLLAIEAYFTNILYLANEEVLTAIWTLLGLPEKHPVDMFLDIMCPDTSNEVTDAIGQWAREKKYDGIIYPSARYGQRLNREELIAEGKVPFPLINYTPVGSRIDMTFAPSMSRVVWDRYMHDKGVSLENWARLYAELNLVLFSGKQVAGANGAVFYQCVPFEQAGRVAQQDLRMGCKHWIVYA